MSISIDFTVRLISVDLIDVASTMVRQGRHHDERYPNFQDLVASVAAVGILHPVIVREEGARYVLISGKRRYYAAKAASLTMIPAMLCTLPINQAWIVQMIETMHHQTVLGYRRRQRILVRAHPARDADPPDCPDDQQVAVVRAPSPGDRAQQDLERGCR